MVYSQQIGTANILAQIYHISTPLRTKCRTCFSTVCIDKCLLLDCWYIHFALRIKSCLWKSSIVVNTMQVDRKSAKVQAIGKCASNPQRCKQSTKVQAIDKGASNRQRCKQSTTLSFTMWFRILMINPLCFCVCVFCWWLVEYHGWIRRTYQCCWSIHLKVYNTWWLTVF